MTKKQANRQQALMWVVKDLERHPVNGAQLQGRQWLGRLAPMGARELARRMTAVGTYREEDEARRGIVISEADRSVIEKVSAWGGRAARRAALALAQTRNPRRRQAHSATLRRLAPVATQPSRAASAPAFRRAREARRVGAA